MCHWWHRCIIKKALDANDQPRTVDVYGIDNHEITNVPIVTAGAVVPSQNGEVIAIFNQYAHTGQGKTIHSSGQLEWFHNDVNDRSNKIKGGLQLIKTNDGYAHPIDIHQGLPYVQMRPYTDDEWDTLPHVVWTADTTWDPFLSDVDEQLMVSRRFRDWMRDIANLVEE